MSNYLIFTRTWWKTEAGELVPNTSAKRHYIGKAATEEEARKICQTWNATNDPGRLSRKAEFDRV